jgi:hypothetical protein
LLDEQFESDPEIRNGCLTDAGFVSPGESNLP